MRLLLLYNGYVINLHDGTSKRCGMNRCFGFLLIFSVTCNCVEYDWKPGFHITPEYGWMNDPHPAFSRG